MKATISRVPQLLFVVVLLMVPESVFAYGGPGSVISGIGALLALVAALIAGLFGFFWFPLKRLYRRVRGNRKTAEEVVTQRPGQ